MKKVLNVVDLEVRLHKWAWPDRRISAVAISNILFILRAVIREKL